MFKKITAVLISTLMVLACTQAFATIEPTQYTEYVDFGGWRVGSRTSRDLHFVARDTDLVISNIVTNGQGFSTMRFCPPILKVGDTCHVRFTFSPVRRGFHQGDSFIFTNKGAIKVVLRGHGL